MTEKETDVSLDFSPRGSGQWTIPQSSLHKYNIQKPPTPVGYWMLYAGSVPYTVFAMYAKPTDEQIKNTEELLGWKWKDSL